MKSWTNWMGFNKEGIKKIPSDEYGVYAIRKKSSKNIIYIGTTKKKRIKIRLRNLLNGMEKIIDANSRDKDGIMKEVAKKTHVAAPKMYRYLEGKNDLEFSYIICKKNSDGVEKMLLAAYVLSNGRLPIYNDCF